MKIPRITFKHPNCPDCTCVKKPKKVRRVTESDWQLGGWIKANEFKSGRPCNFRLGLHHLVVINWLHFNPDSPDKELSAQNIGTSHALQARRCQLRDAGIIVQTGTVLIEGISHMTWSLNDEGERIWRLLCA